MLRRVLHTFVVRRVLGGWRVIVAGALMVAGLVLLGKGVPSFLLGFVLATVLAFMVHVASVWRAHAANLLGRFRAGERPEADFLAADEDATFTSNLGSNTVSWSRFTEVWALPDCWMLFYARSGFLTLPTAVLDADMRAFLSARLPPFR